jgi:hypothetical protein
VDLERFDIRARDVKLLGLVMIVKNEARGIAETLRSVRAISDHWTIVDTGSTDGTQDIIRRELADVPGNLFEEPFVDFSATRNRVVELHGDATRYVIMLSGDDLLRDDIALAADLACGNQDAYYVERRGGDTSYFSSIVFKPTAGWRYVGRTHEVLVKPGAHVTARLPGRVERAADATPEQKRHRWELDRVLLEHDLAANPQDPRTTFYLAQTHECLGRITSAHNLYAARVALGGWREEQYEAAFRRARTAVGHPWPAIEAMFLEAYYLDPARAEPLVEIAEHYYRAGNMASCHLFAVAASQLAMPVRDLFVDRAAYEWRALDLLAVSAFYIGQQLSDSRILKEGRHAAARAVAARPFDQRLITNLAHYERHHAGHLQATS